VSRNHRVGSKTPIIVAHMAISMTNSRPKELNFDLLSEDFWSRYIKRLNRLTIVFKSPCNFRILVILTFGHAKIRRFWHGRWLFCLRLNSIRWCRSGTTHLFSC
jgi:hypothetical protein